MTDYSKRNNPKFSQHDFDNPLTWLESLSQEDLRDWLRRALWVRITLPLIIPPASRIAVEISTTLKKGSAKLKSTVREIVPVLLREWGRDDPKAVLDDLLIISGRLRAASSEASIADIITRRLGDSEDAVQLRQRGLSVLSGFGCSERTAPLFEQYLKNVEYAAISYRALYRYDLKYAETRLQDIVSIFQDSPDELDMVVRTLFRDLQSPSQLVDILVEYLREAEPRSILDVVEALRCAGVFNAELFIRAKPTHRIKVFRLLLERCPPSDLQQLLLRLKPVGISFYSLRQRDGTELIQAISYDSLSEQRISDSIVSTHELSEEVMEAFVIGSEPLAWVETISGNEWVN